MLHRLSGGDVWCSHAEPGTARLTVCVRVGSSSTTGARRFTARLAAMTDADAECWRQQTAQQHPVSGRSSFGPSIRHHASIDFRQHGSPVTWQAASTHVTRAREAAVIHALPGTAILKTKHVTQFYTQNDACQHGQKPAHNPVHVLLNDAAFPFLTKAAANWLGMAQDGSNNWRRLRRTKWC